MGIDNFSHANTNASQPDALIQKAVGDMHLGLMNSQTFSDDIRALYTRDQGNQVRLNADLRTLNDELVANKTLPNALIVGEDSKGDIIYDLPTAHKIGVVDINQKEVDKGPDKEMAAKYGVTVQKQDIWNGVFSPAELAARAKGDSTNPQNSQGSTYSPAGRVSPEAGYTQSPTYNPVTNELPDSGYSQAPLYNTGGDNNPSYGYQPTENGYSNQPTDNGYSNQPTENGYSYQPTDNGYSYPPAETGYAQPESPYSYGPAEPPPPYGYATEAPNRYYPPTLDVPPLQYNRPRAEIVINPVGIVRDVEKLFKK